VLNCLTKDVAALVDVTLHCRNKGMAVINVFRNYQDKWGAQVDTAKL